MLFPTPEYVALVQRERDSTIRSDRLARVAACVRASCEPSLFDRVARVIRGTPAAC
jgi:hypothetical protein